MAYKINKDTCISCGVCAVDCPFQAILEESGSYRIAEDLCQSCGICEGSCPNSAISE